MATNTGKGSRIGSIKDRSQIVNPKTNDYTKRDDDTGRFIGQKQGGKPYKGVAKEPDGRK